MACKAGGRGRPFGSLDGGPDEDEDDAAAIVEERERERESWVVSVYAGCNNTRREQLRKGALQIIRSREGVGVDDLADGVWRCLAPIPESWHGSVVG